MIEFSNVNVIPMTSESVIWNTSMAVENGVISAIGNTPGDECRIIDCNGGFMLPGLCDMHVHLEAAADNDYYFSGVEKRKTIAGIDWNQYIKVYLAFGVTLVRNMSGTPEILRLRDSIESGEIEGPHIYSLSPILDGPNPVWPTNVEILTKEQAAVAVLDAKEKGYDGIKIYNNLSKETFDVIVETAAEVGLTVSGHVPIRVDLDYCLESKMRGYEHAKAIFRTHLIKAAHMHKILTPTLVTQKYLEQYADENIRQQVIENGQTHHLSPEALISWKTLSEKLSNYNFRTDRSSEEYRADMKIYLENGGVLLSGTDSTFLFSLPGYSLHDELVELNRGGLTTYETLKTSTVCAAEFIGAEARRGTLECGKEADMVLVRNNPLDDIHNTADILGVMIMGRWYDKSDIARLLEDVDNETNLYYKNEILNPEVRNENR
jgi:imidazolonepropionase-like amidohydrolase